MGRRLGQQDGYPAGVDNSHSHFHADDPPCCCGHMPDEHNPEWTGPCGVEDCDCVAFEQVLEAE